MYKFVNAIDNTIENASIRPRFRCINNRRLYLDQEELVVTHGNS